MTWREFFLRYFGPGLLGGVTCGDWISLLRQNHFALDPRCLLRISAISWQSLANSAGGWYERRRFGKQIAAAVVEPPIFVLGHWRSGTTLLHNLLTVDERFAFPNTFQTLFPHTFLSTEATNARVLGWFMTPRRPMDNVEWHIASPQEDEFALAVAAGISPCLGWVFPQRQAEYDRHLTLRDVSPAELARWQATLIWFLQKLTVKYGKPLVLKSPPHTCRIKLLLDLFPDARFVHIHRHPYAVFPSSRHTFHTNVDLLRVQRKQLAGGEEWALDQYVRMYDVFFEERSLIPTGRFHEVAFEDLEADPLGELRKLYAALNLPAFSAVERAPARYVAALHGYQKNAFPELPAELRQRIFERWRRSFEAWGYER